MRTVSTVNRSCLFVCLFVCILNASVVSYYSFLCSFHPLVATRCLHLLCTHTQNFIGKLVRVFVCLFVRLNMPWCLYVGKCSLQFQFSLIIFQSFHSAIESNALADSWFNLSSSFYVVGTNWLLFMIMLMWCQLCNVVAAVLCNRCWLHSFPSSLCWFLPLAQRPDQIEKNRANTHEKYCLYTSSWFISGFLVFQSFILQISFPTSWK